ncbi:hypothetical protein AMATHDRAFT_48250 [Amanita thiersii Skay4041]|uniref:Uncharacterized protein n=1 Tax=Amanita thiersii Skay4041 TaxID=703135 RepID=A0A2A9NG57_9AGAR|nr:hypothetical protein AMATHDRAFT_48250 [Amanita thiersii Skay4041]
MVQSRLKNTILYTVPEPISGPLLGLDKRVQAPEGAAAAEFNVEPPLFNEEALMAIYEDILSAPKPELGPGTDNIALQVSQEEEDLVMIGVVEQWLQGSFPSVDDLENATIEPNNSSYTV